MQESGTPPKSGVCVCVCVCVREREREREREWVDGGYTDHKSRG